MRGDPPTDGTVFVFPDCGHDWIAAAAQLLETSEAFADEMLRCDAAFTEFVDWSLLDVLRGERDSRPVTGMVAFAVTVSVAASWRANGVRPDAVMGHARGEVAAAYVADALTLRDAARVVTLAGAWPPTDHAPPTAEHVDAVREMFRESLDDLLPNVGDVVFVSTVTGAALDPSILDGEYWFANLRQPPLFEDAVRWSYEHGYRRFLEASPCPGLAVDIEQTLRRLGGL